MTRIQRGNIWIADLNPGFGVEIHKKRPVLILSNDFINDNWPRVVILPLSSQAYPLNLAKVFIPKGEIGILKDSAVLVTELRSVDKKRLLKKIGDLSQEKLEEVEKAVELVLDLKP